MPRPSVSRFATRMIGPSTCAERLGHPADEQRRHQAREEAARPDDRGLEPADGLRHLAVQASGRIEPHAPDLPAVALPRVDLDLPCRAGAVGELRANRRVLDAGRPDAAAAAEQRPQTVDGREEVAAVLLHHRQQEVSAGVARQPRVLERREPRQQDAARLGLVARQGQRALEDVAGRQHAELVAQHPRAAAAVEHGDDRVDLQPGVGLQAAEQARESRAATDASDLDLAQAHEAHSTPACGRRLAAGGSLFRPTPYARRLPPRCSPGPKTRPAFRSRRWRARRGPGRREGRLWRGPPSGARSDEPGHDWRLTGRPQPRVASRSTRITSVPR